ncbi:MAG TPA: TonB-dependent receptor plug domain-containing protein, partial [Gemmatimonas sp.]|nr:TonB-dependent receptor plug domain-containing protein [Gemmatimonas sp.]
GRFTIVGVPPGVRQLELRAIGFRASTLGINVRPLQQVERTITLERSAALLGAVMIRGVRTATWDSAGFEERRQRGSGYFFTAEQLRDAADLATTLRMVPGISGRSSQRGQRLIVGRGAGCEPAFVVNGVRFEAGGGIGPESTMRPQDIRAMEVYTSRLATPPEHQRFADCAVIVIWLRDPQREREAEARRRVPPVPDAR